MKGRLIVFEGIDGSGKSTQFEKACERLTREKISFQRVVFPQYGEESSALIRMYLSGEFGDRPEDVSPYAASAFYAVDRYASYARVWKDHYSRGGLVLADRYTTSNAVHQGAKLPRCERADFFKWLEAFEYSQMGLPAPDMVLYMDVPLEAALNNIEKRAWATGIDGDIHETHRHYLAKCHETADLAAELWGWIKIQCVKNGKMRGPDEIHREIYGIMTSES